MGSVHKLTASRHIIPAFALKANCDLNIFPSWVTTVGSEVGENSREIKIFMFYKVVMVVQPLVVKRQKLKNTKLKRGGHIFFLVEKESCHLLIISNCE